MNIYEKLLNIQTELKAPKNQYNDFGKYNYRNCEDILEAVKPLCAKHQAACVLTDEIVMLGDRFYVKATATLINTENGERISNSASAREDATKKGMDGAQLTGSTSSYARKYALNGLFAIDDTKDSDTPKTRAELRKALIDCLKINGIDIKQYSEKHGLDKNATAEKYAELLKEFED